MVRWKKLLGDLRATWGRVLVMQLAIALALAAVGTALGARTVLGREIAASYRSTHPADATFEVAGEVDDALLAATRARLEVADADRRQMVRARVRLHPEDPWQMLVLYVADFDALRLATFRPDQGAWPPPPGAILVERTAVSVMGVGGGAHHMPAGGHGAMLAALLAPRLTVQTPHGPPTEVAVAGTVHDAGQAPNWQEHRGCAYATRETLALLGEPPALHELLVEFRGVRSDGDVEAAARELATWLRANGHAVHEIRVPPWHQHPHQALMNAVQSVLLAFTLMLLVLSSIVVATLLATILARQTHDIGVMKAVGATTAQIAGLYAAFVLALAVFATAIALPLAHVAAHGMIGATAYMMNITVADSTIPAWVYATTALLGVVIVGTIAAVPIVRSSRLTVREALAGSGASFVRPGLARLPIVMRSALRGPARLALVMLLLVAGGALVIAASNLDRSLRSISARLADARHYDLEVRLHALAPPGVLAELAALRGVTALESWAAADASLGDVVHTYPDGGHGSFMLAAPPASGTTLVTFPLRAGRWLVPTDTDAAVLGNNAAGGRHVGDSLAIDVDGVPATFTIVGIVEEMAGSSAFVTRAAFERATGSTGPTLLRFATTDRSDAERAATTARIEGALAAHGIAVRYALPAPLLRTIIDDHVALVTRAVIILAVVLALVGLFGLGAATAIQVAERTRELAILKTIGASNRRILRIVLGEAAFVGAASAVLAVIVSFPLTLFVDARLGATGLLANPELVIAPLALLGWPVITIAGSVLAALIPARRAARLTVTAALAEL